MDIEMPDKIQEILKSHNFELEKLKAYKKIGETTLYSANLKKMTTFGNYVGYCYNFELTATSFTNTVKELIQNFRAKHEADKIWYNRSNGLMGMGYPTYRFICDEMNELRNEIDEMWLEMSNYCLSAEENQISELDNNIEAEPDFDI